ncbi:putative membrane protein [Leptospira broomii serovar Hurstbridge str. 5399]|uniref:Membrane protein n=1 Tax=Leptospira broomii serovar Hurstbridge str. 5399 TaxID=1049789 RepID=T0F587_9LEPT|nr:putative membrane protein [Leptospira broomii serovar Hurstbridge str. 5399]
MREDLRENKFLSFSGDFYRKIYKLLENQNTLILLFIFIYSLSSLLVWKKYDWNPTSQINFGKEYCDLNSLQVPKGAIVFHGEEGNLGAGYDGQIFYFYSRMISGLALDWPNGFETSVRAPRIGYPLLAAPFGWLGPYGTIFGMYFLHIFFMIISFLAIRDLLPNRQKILSVFYLFSPFALGSYILLVSDTILISLLVFAYWAYKKERFILFSLVGGLALLTKEQALFLLFPLGVDSLLKKDFRRSLWILTSLVLPGLWNLFLKFKFPEATPARFADFFDPLGGIIGYLREIYGLMVGSVPLDGGLFRSLAKKFSRFPLLILFLSGCTLLFRGDWKKGFPFRLGFALTMFSIFSAGYILYWATYENISRMFTVSIPLLILWQAEDDRLSAWHYWGICGIVLILFFVKIAFIAKPMTNSIW